MTALVTGFGPFLGVADNASARVAERLEGRTIAGVSVVGRVLPVSFARAPLALRGYLNVLRPRCVIATGVARGAEARLERHARNVAGDTCPDVDGVCGGGGLLAHDGPAARLTPLPLATWAAALSTPALPVRTSDDAGDYVCNAVYYALLGAIGRQTAGAFVHLPRALSPDKLSAATALVAAVVERALRWAAPRTEACS